MPQLKMEQLRIWNEAYRSGTPMVSDFEYDNLLSQVEDQLEASAYELFRSTLTENGGDVVHEYIIGSLRKCKYGQEQLFKFIAEQSIAKIMAAAKLDGISYVAKYLNGVLILCATRGDGQTGEDITANARYVLPNMLPINGLLEIRGEFVIPKDLAPTIGYKNARNGVVGLMTKEDADPNILATCVRGPVYQILNSDKTRAEQYQDLELLGFELPETEIFTCGNTDVVEEELKNFLEYLHENSQYLIDGLVISSPDHIHENAMLPKSMVAFKVDRDFVTTKVLDMRIETSKEGRLKGVACVEPAEINGTTVSNVSIFNFAYVDENKIGPGASVIITKSGEIIPKIVEVLETGEINFDKYWAACPSCGAVTELDGVDMRCTNDPAECPAQNVKSVTHFLRNMDILGASETSLEKWGINSVLDCLTFVPIDRNGEKFKVAFEEKVFSSSKEDLLACLNWNGVGKSIFAKIFAVADVDWIAQSAIHHCPLQITVEGVGDLVWEKICNMMEANLAIVETITSDDRYNFRYTVTEAPSKDSAVAGKSFCCTGTLSRGRKEVEADIKAAGGEIKSVSSKLDYLVVGEKAGSKKTKAEKMGIKILTEEQLMELLG